MYYKLIDNQSIVGVIASTNFRKYQQKHGLILFANEETGQFVEYNGNYFYDDWLRAMPNDCDLECELVDIICIDEEEYNKLIEQLDTGNIPIDNSLNNIVDVIIEENPIDEEQIVIQKTAAQLLEEQIKLAARFAEV